MSTLELAIRYVHIACGVVTLITGALNLVVVPKGQRAHRVLGLVYFWCMATIFATALLLAAVFSFNVFLLGIAVLSFYAAVSGYRVLKRKKVGSATGLDWFAAVLTLLTGIVFSGFGLYWLMATENHVTSGALSVFFGIITILAARSDIKLFRKKKMSDRLWWLYQHISSMSASFIAAFTAFLVQNNGRIFPQEYGWIGWVLPTIIGAPLISRYIRMYKRKSGPRRKIPREGAAR